MMVMLSRASPGHLGPGVCESPPKPLCSGTRLRPWGNKPQTQPRSPCRACCGCPCLLPAPVHRSPQAVPRWQGRSHLHSPPAQGLGVSWRPPKTRTSPEVVPPPGYAVIFGASHAPAMCACSLVGPPDLGPQPICPHPRRQPVTFWPAWEEERGLSLPHHELTSQHRTLVTVPVPQLPLGVTAGKHKVGFLPTSQVVLHPTEPKEGETPPQTLSPREKSPVGIGHLHMHVATGPGDNEHHRVQSSTGCPQHWHPPTLSP